jgi:hypothetical protein
MAAVVEAPRVAGLAVTARPEPASLQAAVAEAVRRVAASADPERWPMARAAQPAVPVEEAMEMCRA